MASPVPAKLQSLHNFSLTHLNWKNHRTGRSRIAGEASSSSPPLRSHNYTSQSNANRRPSPLHKQSRNSELEADPNDVGSRMISESSPYSVETKNHKGKRTNKISIHLRENSKQNDAVSVAEENHSFTPIDDSVPPAAAASEDESSPKTWNLRPRRPPVNQKQSAGGFPSIGTSRLRESNTNYEINRNKQLSELNNDNHTDTRKLKRQKFSIPLTRGEIEEDILLLTGSKPSRRPKKRPRIIQKQLDNLFPGLWLDSITADSYKVSETPSKG